MHDLIDLFCVWWPLILQLFPSSVDFCVVDAFLCFAKDKLQYITWDTWCGISFLPSFLGFRIFLSLE